MIIAVTDLYEGSLIESGEASVFFFEKKNQKTLIRDPRSLGHRRITGRSFLVLFSKKNTLACFRFGQRDCAQDKSLSKRLVLGVKQ